MIKRLTTNTYSPKYLRRVDMSRWEIFYLPRSEKPIPEELCEEDLENFLKCCMAAIETRKPAETMLEIGGRIHIMEAQHVRLQTVSCFVQEL